MTMSVPQPDPAGKTVPAETDADLDAEARALLRTPVVAGLSVILVAIGGFSAWAFTARLDAAAVAQGTVVVNSRRKAVSHLEGGILKTLLRQEGDMVREGEPLLRLDDTRVRAELQQLRAKRVGFEARLARLRAEQADADRIAFPDWIVRDESTIAREVVAAERRLFAARREIFEGRTRIQAKVIEQQQAEADALSAQIVAIERQRELVDDEIRIVGDLVEKRYAKRSQLVELQTRQSELAGRAGEYAARRAKAEQAVAGARLEILSIGLERQGEVASDLQVAQLSLSEIDDKIVGAEDVLRRLVVTSPQDGSVTNLRYRTPGGVIPAGDVILEIVPEKEPLIVEAKVEPRDIDAVHVGSETHVRLTAFNARLLPPLKAQVSYVAADQMIDDKTGAGYFVVRAEILPQSLQASQVTLYPGMPAEVMVVNGSRLAIEYLVAPLRDSFSRAFREE